MAKEVDYTKIKVCPKCGSTDLKATVVVSCVQNPEGAWTIILPEQEDLDYEMNNVNIEVTCTNPYCGEVYDTDGRLHDFKSMENPLKYWLKEVVKLPEIPAVVNEEEFREINPEQYELYQEWLEGLEHTPWTGKIGECTLL